MGFISFSLTLFHFYKSYQNKFVYQQISKFIFYPFIRWILNKKYLPISNIFLMIPLDVLDPDWQLATRHAKAITAEKPIKVRDSRQYSKCQCCLNIIEKEPIPLCENTKELEFLGYGFPLLYSFIKNCGILLLLMIGCYSLPEIYKNIKLNDRKCQESAETWKPSHLNFRPHHTETAQIVCTTFMTHIASIESYVAGMEQILRISSFIIILMFLIYMRDAITKKELYYRQRNTTLSDFAIKIKKIPNDLRGVKKALLQFFTRGFSIKGDVADIILMPDNLEIERLQKEKEKILQKLSKHYKKNRNNQQTDELQRDLKALRGQIIDEARRMQKDVVDDKVSCEKAIVVLSLQEQKNKILKEYDKMSDEAKIQAFGAGGERVEMTIAPNPKEIIWNNIDVTNERRVSLKTLGWILSILVLTVVTVIYYFMRVSTVRDLMKNKDHSQVSVIAIKLPYILVVLFNKLLMSAMFKKFAALEAHDTKAKLEFSFALKYCLGSFFTTALMILAVEGLTFHNYYRHHFGVVESESTLFFMNAFVVPLIWVINPKYLLQECKRKRLFGKKHLTQDEANHVAAHRQYEMGKKYSEVINKVWFTTLYASLIPMGAIVSLVGLFIYYWVDKYNLLRRSSIESEVSGKLVKTVMKLLDFILILKPLGEIIFDTWIREGAQLSSIIMMIIGIIYVLLPVDDLIQTVNDQKFMEEQQTYKEVQSQFINTYRTEHPIIKLLRFERADYH